MKKSILPLKSIAVAILFLAAIGFLLINKKNDLGPQFVANVPANDPVKRAQYEFDLLKDPATGKIPEGIRAAELAEAARMPLREGTSFSPSLANTYSFAGPSNFGGRVRAVVYDVRYNGTSNQTVFAGGVSGGVFKSTNGGTSWTRVTANNVLYSVTCIAQDPRPGFQDHWYYGTGEGIGNSAAIGSTGFYFGHGIYKSTDNGANWTKIPNTPGGEGNLENFDSQFDIVTSLAVNPINGDLYAGTLNTVMRLPGGVSGGAWVTERGVVAGTTAGVVDVKISPTGIVYAGIPGNGFAGLGIANANSVAWEGVWRRDLAGTWTRIAGQGTPAWFNVSVATVASPVGRIVLAIDPNDENNVYMLYDDVTVSDCSGTPKPEAEFGKYNVGSGTWVDLSASLPDEGGCLEGNDPFAVQGGYDLLLAVKPGNSNQIFIGGTNAYRLTSVNTFADATYTSTRIGGYNSPANYGRYANSHPDIHSFTFQPGASNTMICGNDGGVQVTTDNAAPVVAWTDISNGLETYQYYDVAIDPTAGSTKFIGGAQDNGTTYRDAGTNAFVKSLSGDGVSVGISAGNTMHFGGFQESGGLFRKNPAFGENIISANLTPSGVSPNTLFVTLFHLDQDNTENLYYVDFNELWRCTNATTSTTFAASFTELTGISTTIGATSIRSLATTRGAYSAATSKLYFGTNDGRVYRVDDPQNVAAATPPVQINSGAGMPAATIIGLAVHPTNPDLVMAVYSSYGIVSIWVTTNATSGSPTWADAEGNLSLPSIRSVVIVQTNVPEYYVGTSTGLYSTTTLAGIGTVWTKEGSTSIGNAVVSSLVLRTADNRLLIGTHGNGMFSTAVFALPVKLKSFNGKSQPQNNLLYWSVEDEVNSKGYEIERRYADEFKFTTVGFVSTKNDNAKRRDYNFTDVSVDLGKQIVYYRLKQVDLDGRTSISPTVTLNRKASKKFVEYVASNNDRLTIRFNAGNNQQNVSFQILDAAGRLLKKSNILFQTQSIDITALPRGPLVLRIEHPDGRKHVQKFVH